MLAGNICHWIIGAALTLLTTCTIAFAQNRPSGPVKEAGEINGAPFRIDIPEKWNGGLMLWAHGYNVVFRKYDGLESGIGPAVVEAGTSLGYAVAQSAFSRQGFALKEGVLETEALRQYFVKKYGGASPTIIAGSHLGGTVAMDLLERYPDVYDGALSGGAPREPALKWLKERVFDMRLLFDHFFPGLPGSVVKFPDGVNTYVKVREKVAEIAAKQPDRVAVFCRTVNIKRVDELPNVIAFYSEVLRELMERAGANAFDNRNTIYTGSDDDLKLNREIPRYSADAAAAKYLREWSTPTGRIKKPFLTINKLVDDIVPVENAKYYEQLTQIVGASELYVQMYNARVERPSITGPEIKAGLVLLTKWIKEGVRPTPGLLKTNP